MMKIDDDVVDPKPGQVLCDVTNKRLTKNWNGGFGAVFCQGPESCAVTGGENHCTHNQNYRTYRTCTSYRTQAKKNFLGSLRRVSHHQIERAWCYLTKAGVAIK